MGKKEKLIKRLKSRPKDFTFEEAVRIPGQAISEFFRTGGTHMKNTMEYKGYIGSVEFSEADGMFFGKVMGIRSLISYEGTNAKELVDDFHEAVDDYLELCLEQGKAPEKAYKGSFNVRISPELHRQAAICATANQMTLNSFVENAMRKFIVTLPMD